MQLLKVLAATFLFTLTIPSAAREIKVLEIDTGISLSHELIKSHVSSKISSDNINYDDLNGHGTHIAGILLKDTCPQVKLTSCVYFNQFYTNREVIDLYINCLEEAVRQNPDIINISGGGYEKIQQEEELINKLTDKGTIIVAASGNNHINIDQTPHYPSSYPKVLAVGNLEQNGSKNLTSNYGTKVKWEIGTSIKSTYLNGKYATMTGTSQSTAVLTNKLLKSMCKTINDR